MLAAPILLAACGGDEDDGAIVFEDPRGRIQVEQGMRFALQFRVNAGVGYDWEPVAVPTRVALVELKETEVDYPDESREGDSGDKRFVYEAKRSGRQTLVFRRIYRGDPDERRTLTIEIAR